MGPTSHELANGIQGHIGVRLDGECKVYLDATKMLKCEGSAPSNTGQ